MSNLSWPEVYQGAALVTGASSGFGRQFVLQLAQKGMDVILVARRRALLDELAQAVERDHQVRALVVAQDLLEDGADERVAEVR